MKDKIKNISEILFKFLADFINGNNSNLYEITSHWSERDWRTAKTVIIIHGMGPLWGRFIRNGEEFPGMPEFLVKFLVDQYHENSKRVALISKEYQKIAAELFANQVDFVAFKGIELTKSLYDDPGVRPMADIDLYIGKNNIEKTNAVLKKAEYVFHVEGEDGATLYPAGYLSNAAAADSSASWHCLALISKKSNKWYEGESADVPFSIDVHYNMKLNRHFTRYDLTPIFERTKYSENKTLPAEENFVYLALHCSKHLLSCSGRWIQLHDLMLFIKKNNLDANLIAGMSKELKVEHLVLLPLVLARKVFGVSIIELEKLLGQYAGLKYRRLIEKSELSEMSCCNPWGTNLCTSLIWVRSFGDLINGIRCEYRKSEREVVQTGSGYKQSNSLLRRLFRISKSNLKKTPRPLWNMLKIQGLDPKLDWK